MMYLDPSTLCLACRHIRHRHTGPCDVCNCPTFVEAVPPQHAPSHITLDNLDAGIAYLVRCPDGIERVLWGAKRQTGDLCIAGWPGDAWMDCSSGALHVKFDTHTPMGTPDGPAVPRGNGPVAYADDTPAYETTQLYAFCLQRVLKLPRRQHPVVEYPPPGHGRVPHHTRRSDHMATTVLIHRERRRISLHTGVIYTTRCGLHGMQLAVTDHPYEVTCPACKPLPPERYPATLLAIRTRYPHPMAMSKEGRIPDQGYCVGGAICLFADPLTANEHRRFPNHVRLGEALRALNPTLTKQDSEGLAALIILYNDTLEFEKAWQEAAEALQPIKQEPTP